MYLVVWRDHNRDFKNVTTAPTDWSVIDTLNQLSDRGFISSSNKDTDIIIYEVGRQHSYSGFLANPFFQGACSNIILSQGDSEEATGVEIIGWDKRLKENVTLYEGEVDEVVLCSPFNSHNFFNMEVKESKTVLREKKDALLWAEVKMAEEENKVLLRLKQEKK